MSDTPSRIRDWQDHKDHFEWFRDTFHPAYVWKGEAGYAPRGFSIGFTMDTRTGLHLILMEDDPRNTLFGKIWKRCTTTGTFDLRERLKRWQNQRSTLAARANIPADDLRQLATLAAILNPDRPSMDSPPP